MIKILSIKHFKSISNLELELGLVNVFIGANGSGKSNLLEALGVLGAASSGRVDDESLLRRGVRPGVPNLYKTAFPTKTKNPHIYFGAENEKKAKLTVTLWNPLENPSPAWRFKTEKLSLDSKEIVVRSTKSMGTHNQEQGLTALEAVRLKPGNAALELIDQLRGYSIYCPNTPSLRGLIQDTQSREPVGLGGGRMPEALEELLVAAKKKTALADALEQVRGMIDWAKDFSVAASTESPLSPSAARSRQVIRFRDRYMMPTRNTLTGYDASEGALYILYCAVLALHPKSPHCLAVDNLDQALNPRLAQRLMEAICKWTFTINGGRQWLLTVQNPSVLDGLPLTNDKIRLFTVERNSEGHTVINRIDLEAAKKARPDDSWTLSRLWVGGYLGGVPSV